MKKRFRETIDLKSTINLSGPEEAENIEVGKKEKYDQLEKMYERNNEQKEDWQKIKQAPNKKVNWRIVLVFLFLAMAALSIFFFKPFWLNKKEVAKILPTEKQWYAVKLTDGEIFYGQVADTKADPILMEIVYYDYGGVKGQGEDLLQGDNNIRLIKRGQEKYGPSGALNLVRSQVLYLEPLKIDSQILKIILDNEK